MRDLYYVSDTEQSSVFSSVMSDVIRRFFPKIPFSLLFYPTKFAYIKFFLYLCTRFQKCSFSRLEQPLVAVHPNVLQPSTSPRNRLAFLFLPFQGNLIARFPVVIPLYRDSVIPLHHTTLVLCSAMTRRVEWCSVHGTYNAEKDFSYYSD